MPNIKLRTHPALLFTLGIFAGWALWDRIALPFSNPLEVVGPPSRDLFNPWTDLLRVGFVIALPSLLLFLFGREPKPSRIPAAPNSNGKKISQGSTTMNGWLFFLLIAFAILVALNIPTYHAFGKFDPFHEGESLGSALSQMDGQVPYKDYFFFHGVFQDPGRSALAFQLFGKSIGTQRALESILKVILWVVFALFLKHLFSGRALFAWAAIVFTAFLYVPFLFNILSSPFLPAEDPSAVVALFERWQNFFEPFHWVILSGRDLPVLFFLLVFLWILEAGPRVPRLAYVCFSFLPVASLAYSVDRGAYLIGIALVLAWVLYRTAPAKSSFWTSTLFGVLGGVLTLGYAVHWNYSGFFHYVFGELPRYKMLTDKLPYPIHEPKFALALIALAFIPFRLLQRFLAFKLVQKGAFIPVLRAFLVQNAIGLALGLVALACFRNVLERPDLDHLANNSLWTFLFLVWELSLSPKPPFQKGTPRPALAIVCVLALLVSGLGLYRILRFDLMEKNFPFQRSDSTFLSQDRLETVAFLGSVLKKDEPFFAFTVDASWYYLLDRPCPTRYPCLWVAAPRTLQEDVIASLEAKRVRWVLYPGGEWVSNIDGISDAERFPYVDRYLRDHFRFYRKAGGQGIWIRKTKA